MDLKKIIPKNKKGALTLEDAPAAVLVVGFVFLIMATLAYVGEKYGDSFSTSTYTVTNETVTQAELTASSKLNMHVACNVGNFAITSVFLNSNGSVIDSGNYTLTSSDGTFTNSTSEWTMGDWDVSYTYTAGGEACNVTGDMQTELGDNTSIAGIVLTIILVGIVLGVLIGVFMQARGKRI